MDDVLLDTDILSELLKKKDQRVLAHARQYLARHGRLAFSAITAYEIIRGMLATDATRQLKEFRNLVETSDIFQVDMPVLMRAADLWAKARNDDCPRNDADLIIAATALEASRTLITGNKSHFSWIDGLKVADWRDAPRMPTRSKKRKKKDSSSPNVTDDR